MTFLQYAKRITEGDYVIAYSHPQAATCIQVQSSHTLHNKYGLFPHADMIQLEYGSKLSSKNGKGFVYLLHPTPELWTTVLPHRTQILYTVDISLISMFLDLVPGKVVVECGTGSGSFSHAIARCVQPQGKVYSFEYHEERALKARTEFALHGNFFFSSLHQDWGRLPLLNAEMYALMDLA